MVKLPPAGAFRQKRLALGFPEAALLRSAVSSDGHGWIEPLPDFSGYDMEEKIKEFIESDKANYEAEKGDRKC